MILKFTICYFACFVCWYRNLVILITELTVGGIIPCFKEKELKEVIMIRFLEDMKLCNSSNHPKQKDCRDFGQSQISGWLKLSVQNWRGWSFAKVLIVLSSSLKTNMICLIFGTSSSLTISDITDTSIMLESKYHKSYNSSCREIRAAPIFLFDEIRLLELIKNLKLFTIGITQHQPYYLAI